jgi:acyl carrier protein
MKEKILSILSELRPDMDFAEDVDFIEEGMLDSFDMVALVDSLETEFNVIIGATEILPGNFCSLDAIVNLVVKNKQ